MENFSIKNEDKIPEELDYFSYDDLLPLAITRNEAKVVIGGINYEINTEEKYLGMERLS